jgi:predicted phosphate transport protein (TIGR00153 family)
MTSYFSKIFGKSPVDPIQQHMETCFQAAKKLNRFFEAVVDDDWETATAVRAEIVALESEADDLKSQVRSNLPKNLFLPVPREDLLELLAYQDKIANRAKEVSGLVMGRKMKIPAEIREDFLAYVSRNVDAAKKARKSIRELDELFETGFRGAEAKLVESIVAELDQIENDTDDLQAKLRARIFAIEDQLKPVDVMFLYRIFELIGDVADRAESVGHRLELVLSH